jgi:hypothetical protein
VAEETKKPKTLEEVVDHGNAILAKVRMLAISAVAAVVAIGGVAIAIIDQVAAARQHWLVQKTEQIDQHLQKTDEVVVDNAKRLNAVPDAPPAAVPSPPAPVAP